MQQDTMLDVIRYKKNNRRRRIWKRIVGFMACIVVFCTTYALILPAITSEQTYLCGLEEHSHGDACYDETGTLICGMEEHTHTDECQAYADLTEEELAQVQAVIARIDELEGTEEVESRLAAYEDAEDMEGYAAYRAEALEKTQAVRDLYNALSDAQKLKVTNAAKLTQLDWLAPITMEDADIIVSASSDSSTILESLDGDWAYISDFIMKSDTTTASGYAVRTGTEPFDSDDEAGNDRSALNNVLRTFDTATYTIQFNTTLRDAIAAGDVGGIEQGRLYFEFVLPLTAEEVRFETSAMGWLSSSQSIRYEVVTATVNGTESQVLRGSFVLVPTGSNQSAIGASTNEMSVVIRALQMSNGETIQPTFTLWLQHNEVGATYNEEDDRLPASIVTGTSATCSAHGEAEAQTLVGQELTISARPMFNIALIGINANNSTVGTFDFDDYVTKTGIPRPTINVGVGEVYGRMNGYGIRIELQGKQGQGMRGCEFPDEGTAISLDIAVKSTYQYGTVAEFEVQNYQALFWSGDANASRGDGTYNNDGRYIYTSRSHIHSTIPYNLTKAKEEYKRCYNGGNWTFTQDEDGLIHVTVTGFVFNTGKPTNANATAPFYFPYSYTSGTADSTYFYDPNTIYENYWEIEQAVFSAGELWLVQPYNGLKGTDDADVYIAEKYGEGQFYTAVELVNLYIQSGSGQAIDELSEQSRLRLNSYKVGTADDRVHSGQYLKTPGGIDARIIYAKGETTSVTSPLVDGAQRYDYDWATVGTEVTLTTWIYHGKAEAEYVGVAYDNLIKFDDEFFLPDVNTSTTKTPNNYKLSGVKSNQTSIVLWAAKPDGSGWKDDEEMKAATMDDLVYYTSLDDLNAAGVTCVGVMFEIRGVGEESGENQFILYVDGIIRSDCEANKVYMVTRTSYAWSKKMVADAALEYHNKMHPDAAYESVNQLTNVDYDEYMQDSANGFPSRVGNTAKMLGSDGMTVDQDYPVPFWRQDYYVTSKAAGYTVGTNIGSNGMVATDTVSALKTVQKASYDDGFYQSGVGAYFYQDSCLVVAYKTTIDKSVAQTESSSTGAVKSVYDMGQNQRTVDYVLTGKISFNATGQGGSYTGPGMTTTIYIEDTIPADLTYILGSAYLGGTYTQDASHQNQGTVMNGAQFISTSVANTYTPTETYPYLESVTYNDDGTTTIRWIFNVTLGENVASWSEKLYFSCSIGSPGAASDVQDGDQITNTAYIWTSDNNLIDFSENYGNMDTYGISILKTTAISLSKLSDHLVLEWWDEFGFTMNVGNNSGAEKKGTVIVETLPYNGLYRSDFTGRLVVSEFSAGIYDAANALVADGLDSFTFYYTTDPAYAGWRSMDYIEAAQAQSMTVADWLAARLAADPAQWVVVSFNSSTSVVNEMELYSASDLPVWDESADADNSGYQQITSVVAVGDLAAGVTMKLHVGIKLPEGAAGDYMINYLSQDSLTSYARAQAVNRSIEGLAWLDKDADGMQDAGEPLLTGVKVVLQKLNETTGKYENYLFGSKNQAAYVNTGKMLSVQADTRDDAVDYIAGYYKFTDLPAGTYQIQFKYDGDHDIRVYLPSPYNVEGVSDEVDSDGVPQYTNGVLVRTEIPGIVMEEVRELTNGLQESRNNDSGFYYPRYELPSTGGTGTQLYTTGGMLLITAAVTLLLYSHKKRRKEAQASS